MFDKAAFDKEKKLRNAINHILCGFEQNRMKFRKPPIIPTLSYQEAEDALVSLLTHN